MSARVVDCSALAAVLFTEPEAGSVVTRLAGATLHAPTLLPYELANSAWKKAKKHPESKETVEAALLAGLRMPIALHAVPCEEVWALALKTRLTAYDASYLWLAQHLDCELVSLDPQLDEAARRATQVDQ